MLREPLNPGRGSIVGRVVLKGKSVHVVDAQADSDPELANRSLVRERAFDARRTITARRNAQSESYFCTAVLSSHSPTKQIELVETLLTKPLSPSRIRACSTKYRLARATCPSRWSNRQRLRRF